MIICWTKRLLIIILSLMLLLSAAAVIFLLVIHQETPLQQSAVIVDASTAKMAKSALSRNVKQLRSNKSQLNFKLSQSELTSLVAIAQRTNKNIAATANFSAAGLYTEFTLTSLFNRYINVSFLVTPSQRGLELDFLRIGPLEIPPKLSLNLLDFVLKSITKTDIVSRVNYVSVRDNLLHVGYQMENDKHQFIQSLSRLAGQFSSQQANDSDLALTSYYYDQIQLLFRLPDACKQQPLSYFIHYLARLDIPDDGSEYSAVAKNRAAIFALSIYFGSYRFEYIVGKLSVTSRDKGRCYYIPTLGKRTDLTKHFLYSAAIELLSSTSTSKFIGELKELLDSNLNGSGFSFVDLMADRAGVQFARLATQNEKSAAQFHYKIKQGLTDHQLLPSITQLSENLSQQQFEQAYQHIDAPAYHRLIQQIDRRLTRLRIYAD